MAVDVAFKVAAALVTGTFGVFTLLGAPRRPANRLLAAFLFLIAGNQTAEVFRSLSRLPADQLFWFQIASALAFLDPLFLYAFGSVFPERNALAGRWRLALVAAPCVILALSAPALNRYFSDEPFTLAVISAWTVVTALVYATVLWTVVRNAMDHPSQRGSQVLVPALFIATMPGIERAAGFVSTRGIPGDLPVAVLGLPPEADGALVGFGATLVATAALLWAGLRRAEGAPASRRALWVGAAAGLVVTLAVNASQVKRLGAVLGLWSAPYPGWIPPAAAGGALKWLLFSALASAALLRNQMLGFSMKTRRRAARVLAAAVLLGTLAGVGILAGRTLPGGEGLPGPAVWTLFGVALLASQGFRTLVDWVAEKAYGVPRRTDSPQALEAYRAGVEQALREDRSPVADARLRRLRDELGLDERTAAVVERMAEPSDGGPLVPGEVLQGRYRIEDFLGRGGGGRTFLARDELLERDVAVKEVLHEGEAQTARALREAQAAGRVDHANVVAVHDVLQRPGASLLVTEHVDGGSLADRLAREGALAPREAVGVLDGVLSGLEAVHAEGVAHGDLKPDNVLVTERGVPKIADFGTSRTRDDETRDAVDRWAGAGTPAYMAPERRRGQPPSAAADVYAVGLIAREICREPVPDGLEAVIDRATADDPDERWGSASRMREALRDRGCRTYFA